MFKRIAKKQKKQKRDEELGLDEETKQVFGMQDTDSDESDSGSSSASGSGLTSEDDSDEEGGSEIEDGAGLQTEYLAADDDGSEDEGGSDEEGLDLDDESPMSISEAVEDPIYVSSMEPMEMRACIVCPNKMLKNNTMVEVHLKSGVRSPKLLQLFT